MSDPFDSFKESLKKSYHFNWKRLQVAFLEMKFIYEIARANRFWWPGIFVGFIILSSVAMNLTYLVSDKMLVLIQGENPVRTNYEAAKAKNSDFLNGESIELFSAQLPKPETPFYFRYEFTVLKDNDYWIILGGTPPGSIIPNKSVDWFSPYWISVDGETPIHITHEHLEEYFPKDPRGTEYVGGGYHWTRVGSRFLKKGPHHLEFIVDEPRVLDGKYVFYLDAIVLAPKGWKPLRSLSYIPWQIVVDYEIESHTASPYSKPEKK